MKNLRFGFGQFKPELNKQWWDFEGSKVKCVLECIGDSKYYPNPLKIACDPRSLSVSEILEDKTTKCVGCIYTETSFATEVLFDIILHPSIISQSQEIQDEYYISIYNKLENLLREIGYSDMKTWLLESDERLCKMYNDLGYDYLDGGENALDEPSILVSKPL